MAFIKLRKVIWQNPKLKIRGIDGRFVPITARPLSAGSERNILSAISCIVSRYNPEVFDVPLNSILGIAQATVFLQSDSPEVGAYMSDCGGPSDALRNPPMMFLNRKLLKPECAEEKKELAVTILHELIHILHDEAIDKKSTSEDEARFDLGCYKALNFDIPADHWAFKKLGIDVDKLLEERK